MYLNSLEPVENDITEISFKKTEGWVVESSNFSSWLLKRFKCVIQSRTTVQGPFVWYLWMRATECVKNRLRLATGFPEAAHQMILSGVRISSSKFSNNKPRGGGAQRGYSWKAIRICGSKRSGTAQSLLRTGKTVEASTLLERISQTNRHVYQARAQGLKRTLAH
jgi:hypothetical protein